MERDGRVMNHMAPELKTTHARLERWGCWARTAGVRAWPQVTLLGRIIALGPEGACIPSSAVRTAIPDDISEVDAAVARLREIDKAVIRTYYLDWAPVEVMARHRRMSTARFHVSLRRARWRVHDYLLVLQELRPDLMLKTDRSIRLTTEFAA